MGRRGPAPKPTAIKKAEGNPGKRKLNMSSNSSEANALRKRSWSRSSKRGASAS